MTIFFETLIIVGSLGISLGFLLGIASLYFKVKEDPFEKEIEAILPGAQCGQCGYPGCGPAAKAFISGKLSITACIPGGPNVMKQLAKALKVTEDKVEELKFAFIDESKCIGCTKCKQDCMTDCIIGGPKMIHTIISEECAGCGKCENICPTMAITMKKFEISINDWYWQKPKLHYKKKK